MPARWRSRRSRSSARLLADPLTTAVFDHVVFDTAPTGHTLRLLSLPAAWSSFIDTNSSGTSCLGPLVGLQEQRSLYGNAVKTLCDPKLTTLVLVTRADRIALTETTRSSAELVAIGVRNQHLVVNAVFRAQASDDPIAQAMQRRGRNALDSLPGTLAQLSRTEIPLAPNNLLGVEALRNVFHDIPPETEGRRTHIHRPEILPGPLKQLIDDIAPTPRGVVLVMGKGGVGKTTVAAVVALELARRGYSVHLTTTDPAAHVEYALETKPNGLTVSRIDPQVETRLYQAEVLAAAGADLDAGGRALLEEDLRSPCTEEIAVFRAFAKVVDQGRDGIVVLDTAPTGHTILLLDAALAYHREVSRQSNGIPQSVRQLLPRLRDPEFTRILIVTLPEATPVHEAAQLQEDLRRADLRHVRLDHQPESHTSVRDRSSAAGEAATRGDVHRGSDAEVSASHGDHPVARRIAGRCRETPDHGSRRDRGRDIARSHVHSPQGQRGHGGRDPQIGDLANQYLAAAAEDEKLRFSLCGVSTAGSSRWERGRRCVSLEQVCTESFCFRSGR